MRIWGQKQWYRADHIPISPSSSSHRPLRLSSLFFFFSFILVTLQKKRTSFHSREQKNLKNCQNAHSWAHMLNQGRLHLRLVVIVPSDCYH